MRLRPEVPAKALACSFDCLFASSGRCWLYLIILRSASAVHLGAVGLGSLQLVPAFLFVSIPRPRCCRSHFIAVCPARRFLFPGRMMVLDGGVIAEFDEPKTLLGAVANA